MDRKRNSEKEEPQQHPIEPEMEERPGEPPQSEPSEEKPGDDL